MDGIRLGVSLRQAGFDGKIIYLTASREYAIESFKARPFDYLLKPVGREALFSVLDEAIQSVAGQKETGIIVKTKDGSRKLAFDSILFAELKNKGIHYHLTNGKIIESTSIRTGFGEAVQEMLRDHRFFMCSTSMVVNLYHVHTVTNDTLTFQNGQSIYLSRRADGCAC